MPFIALAVAVAAALGGGAAMAAERSLPGDALWSFKIHVNESLQTSLAGSAEARATRHIEAIETRMEEAEQLVAEGRLDTRAHARIEQNVNAHTMKITNVIADLEAAGNLDAAADIAARYQATVAARAAALAEIESDASEKVSASLSPLLIQVRAALDHASELSADTSAKAAAHSSTNTTAEAGVDADTGINLGI